MKIIRNPKQIREITKRIKKSSKSIGFIPTMGAMHAGHLSLIRKARKDNSVVIVSIFVNPIQFGQNEDLSKYPRPINQDLDFCRKERVDFIYLPSIKDMYPNGYNTYVDVFGLTDSLCAGVRPGHFRGVATVVNKLFNLIQPDVSYFGQKDAQQAVVIKKMVEDLNIPVDIKVMPTIRERDGLAMSSRNIYLSPKERKDAALLYQGLKLVRRLIKQGNRNAGSVIKTIRKFLKQGKYICPQYISLVDFKDLKPVKKLKGKILICLAAFVGKTRLIDNITVKI